MNKPSCYLLNCFIYWINKNAMGINAKIRTGDPPSGSGYGGVGVPVPMGKVGEGTVVAATVGVTAGF